MQSSSSRLISLYLLLVSLSPPHVFPLTLTLSSSIPHSLRLIFTTLLLSCSWLSLHTQTPHPPSLSSDRGAQRRKACLDFKRLPVYLSPPHLNCQGGTALEINSFLPPLRFYSPSPLLTTVCVWFLLSPTIDLPFVHPPSSSVPVCISFSPHFLCLCPPQHLNVMLPVWRLHLSVCVCACEIETIIFYSN